MWFRIVYVDRFLSLMLGLPLGSLDYGLASRANLAKETPLGQLSRIHCAVAAKISERNDGDGTDYEITQEIDEQLQKAANSLPSKWWLTPNLSATDEQSGFQETLRVVEQIYHYNLLNQLYLPFMLEFSHDLADIDARDRHNYAKHTCVNSSREVLSRFNALRSFSGISLCCRSIDFLGLMAAITLLLAHLNSHRLDGSRKFATNLMVHQRLGDRAIIGCMLEYMGDTHHWDTDLLTKKCIDWVWRLLEAEAGAANGQIYTLDRIIVSEDRKQISNEERVIMISIAYFGLIKITREDTMHVEHPRIHTQQLSNGSEGPIESRLTRSQDPSTSSYTTPIHPHSSPSVARLENGNPLVMSNDILVGLSPRTNIEGFNQDLPEFPVFDGDDLQLPCVPTNDATSFEDYAFPNGDRVSFGNLISDLGLDLTEDGSL